MSEQLKEEAAAADAALRNVKLRRCRQAEVIRQARQEYDQLEAEEVLCQEAVKAIKTKQAKSDELTEQISSLLHAFNLPAAETEVRLQFHCLRESRPSLTIPTHYVYSPRTLPMFPPRYHYRRTLPKSPQM